MQKCRFGVLILLCTALLFSGTVTVWSETAFTVSAKSAVLMDANSGKILWAKNAYEELPMASTTKMMTALCALSMSPLSQTITVDPSATNVEGSSVYLQAGEQFTLEELLYALLLESANDAATAIAVGLCGDVSAFAQKMNDYSESLSLEHTHFENPHGLDASGHFSCAFDLACIAKELLEKDELRGVVSTKKTTLPGADGTYTRVLSNHNKLLRTYDGCIGVKTGYTKKSGRCLVSAAERNGTRLIAVTLSDPDDWRDHENLLDYGFSHYRTVKICEAGAPLYEIPIVGGLEDSGVLVAANALSLTVPKNSGNISCKIECPTFLYAPVSCGETVGVATFFADTDGDGKSECLGSVSLHLLNDAPQKKPDGFFRRIFAFFKNLFS